MPRPSTEGLAMTVAIFPAAEILRFAQNDKMKKLRMTMSEGLARRYQLVPDRMEFRSMKDSRAYTPILTEFVIVAPIFLGAVH